MRKRWKWLVAGLVVLMLGAFLVIPSESDGLEAFRRLGPISEETSSLPMVTIVSIDQKKRHSQDDYLVSATKFSYGRLSDSQLAELKEAYKAYYDKNFLVPFETSGTYKVVTKFAKERSVVTLNSMKVPTKWERLWSKVKAFFGKS